MFKASTNKGIKIVLVILVILGLLGTIGVFGINGYVKILLKGILYLRKKRLI